VQAEGTDLRVSYGNPNSLVAQERDQPSMLKGRGSSEGSRSERRENKKRGQPRAVQPTGENGIPPQKKEERKDAPGGKVGKTQRGREGLL